jgi:benzoyl-CoA reductase/2-hydroxyglutaryl-CoA dehydratase subunit BcrC/BadD/HgdB
LIDLTYFEEILNTDRRAAELAADARPVVGTVCNFVPEELILAAGAIPVRVDAGDRAAARVGAELFVRDACGAVRSLVGLLQGGEGLFHHLDLLVIPTACDAKRKLAEFLAATHPVHILHLPTAKDKRPLLQAWAAELRDLISRLQALTGTRITVARLRQAIELLNRRQYAYRALLDLRREDPSLISARQMMTLAAASFTDDPQRWSEQVETLIAALRSGGGHSTPATGPRVLLTGAPLIYPNWMLLDLLEESGLAVVAEEMCSATQRLYHPVVPQEWSLRGMLTALAERSILPSTCPCFVGHDDRLRRLGEVCDELSVNGIVNHTLRTCLPFDAEASAVRDLARQRNLAYLQVQTDYAEADAEQLRTRIEAFRELLEPARSH